MLHILFHNDQTPSYPKEDPSATLNFDTFGITSQILVQVMTKEPEVVTVYQCLW